MNKISRRDAISGVLAAGAGVLALNNITEAQTETLPKAFAGKHQPKPLPFDATKLTGISEKLIRSHHENNYTGAVKALNAVEQRLVALAKEGDMPVSGVEGDEYREVEARLHLGRQAVLRLVGHFDEFFYPTLWVPSSHLKKQPSWSWDCF